MDSALVPSQSGPVFSQQGTVDWTQLANSSVTFSLGVLSRLSQAGIEPFTLAVGQAIFSRFPLPPETQQKIHETLANLKPFSSYGNVLWFGFGIKHVARLLAESEQGIACIALCGSLSVSYDKFYCAQVLRSMTQIQCAPGNLSPSISQWSSLVDVCSGTLVSSEFPNIVEGFCRLWYDYQNVHICKLQAATPPHALGKALSTVAAVASGELHSATFVGGVDCAWIAAIAEWVLRLRVEVQDAKTGHCLYQKINNPEREVPQVLILRNLDEQGSVMRLKDKVCFLPSGTDLFNAHSGNGESVFAGGRSSWNKILSDTFPGDALRRLFSSEAGSAFAYLLRSVAEDIYQQQDGRNVLELLPELKDALLCPQKPGQTIETAEQSIRSACGCERCNDRIHYFERHRGQLCIFHIHYTITCYVWILGHVEWYGNILPSPSGLQQLHLLVIDGGLKITRASRISQNYKSNVLANILRVMTGIPAVESSSLDASAISESGMSICCTTLLGPGLLPTGKAAFCLIPGHIQKDGTLFREVYDLDSKLGMRLGEDAVMKLTFDEKLRIIMSIRQSKSRPELLVKETIEGQRLQANYSWQYELFNDYKPKDHQRGAPKSSRMLVTAFGSADLQRRIFEGVSLPRCDRKQLNVVVPGDKSYSGPCCRIMEDIQMQMDPSSTFLPRPGAWVLLDVGKRRQPGVYDGEEFPTKVYLGSIIELYTLLCNREPGKNLKLSRTSNCLFCTCGWEARTIMLASDRMATAPTERVFADDITVIEPADQEAQTVNHVDTGDCNHQGVNGIASPPPQSPRPKTRPAKRKNARETRGSRKRKGASK